MLSVAVVPFVTDTDIVGGVISPASSIYGSPEVPVPSAISTEASRYTTGRTPYAEYAVLPLVTKPDETTRKTKEAEDELGDMVHIFTIAWVPLTTLP